MSVIQVINWGAYSFNAYIKSETCGRYILPNRFTFRGTILENTKNGVILAVDGGFKIFYGTEKNYPVGERVVIRTNKYTDEVELISVRDFLKE